MFRDGHIDNRPMGHANRSLMVEQFLPHSAFDVVMQVHGHLGMLNQLAHHLPTLNEVSGNLYELRGIQRYLGDLTRVASNLNAVVSIQEHIPLLSSIAPRIEDFAKDLKSTHQDVLHVHHEWSELRGVLASKIKYIEDLYIQYEHGLHQLLSEYSGALKVQSDSAIKTLQGMVQEVAEWRTYLQSNMHIIQQYVTNYESLNARLAHLEASDAVTMALYTKDEADVAKAQKAIRSSEKAGNVEKLNRARLNFPEDNNVLAVIAKNNERLAQTNTEQSCLGGVHV